MIRVVHCKKEKYDVYIGRKRGGFHYGNPWTHLSTSTVPGVIIVPSREVAVMNFEKWITGKDFFWIEPERKKWILASLCSLKDKVLGCWCHPKLCHGDVYTLLINKLCNGTQFKQAI